MKKTLAYITTAILLGFAVIMLPRTILSYPSSWSTMTSDSRNPLPAQFGGESLETKPSLLISQPSSFLPTSTVIASGLVVALTAYAILKKRTT